MGKKVKHSNQKKKTQAELADRHVLYEVAVQNTETEFEFVDGVFRRLRGRKAVTLREDFCGTAGMCCEWVKQRSKNRAIGVDLDSEVLAWGETHNVAKLKPSQRSRVNLLKANE